MNQMVQRFAQLSVIADKFRAQGQQIPRGVHTEMQEIYSRAAATLTAQEQQQALRAVQSFRAQAFQNMKAQAAHAGISKALDQRDQLAQELSGMTVDQIQAAKNGEKYVKRGSKFNARVGKQRIEQMALQASGKKLSFDQIWKHSVALEGEPNKAAYLKKHFGNKANEMDGFFRGFDDSGAALQIKLTEGKYSEDEYVEPNKDEVLRAQITDAVATEMTRDSDTASWAVQGIDEAYLADDGMKGDVARAMLECESREQ